jgi:hypothetical protein
MNMMNRKQLVCSREKRMGGKKPRHQKAKQFLENSYSQNPHKEK